MLRVHATATGGWLTVAIPGTVLLVDSSAGTATAEDLLAALHTSDPLPAALELLAAGGFSAMPGFALVEYRGQSAHYFVRGGVELEFTGPDGARSASGAGITSWSEQLISGVDGFTIAGADAASASGAAALPLIDGAVWGARVEYGAGDAPAAAFSAEESHPAAERRPSAAPLRSASDGPAPVTRPSEIHASAAEETVIPPELDDATVAGPLPALVPESTTGYDHLFGITQLKSVEAAAVRPPDEDADAAAEASAPSASAPGAPAPTATTEDAGDHDGLTMMSGDIAELRRRASAAKSTAAAASAPLAPAEPQFHLELPDGRHEPLDRPVIIGRSPSANKVSGSELPRLITVGGSDPDISRSHVRFTVEGGTVVITDLHSRNGTLMSLPGRPPQKLREGEPTSALAGTIVDLGGGVRITVTETSQAAVR